MLETLLSSLYPTRSLEARAALACAAAFALSLLGGPRLIRGLRRRKLGDIAQKGDSAELDRLSAGKGGTPTMGGVLIVVAALASILLFARLDVFATWLMVASVVCLAAIGAVDDLAKLTSSGRGLRIRTKLALLVVAALGIGLGAYANRLATEEGAVPVAAADELAPALAAELPEPGAGVVTLAVPFTEGGGIPLGALYVLFAAVLVLATTNSVNFADGLDGLCAGASALVVGAYAAIACAAGSADLAAAFSLGHDPRVGEACVLGASFFGAALGFLWFNAHPARVFMGDTGSLALGGAIAVLALTTRHELLLLVLGGVFVLEGLSVALQIAWFKLTGRRIFRCAPIHHHFQFGGLFETQVTTRLWIAGGLLAALVLAALRAS